MSIFKESFQPYVSKQLKIREEIIKGGNQHRFGNPKISFEYPTVNNIVKESVNLPPGAFYTYTTSKQCVIRMSSGVNLTNPNLLENYGFENPNDLLGAGLAIRYILEGGIPAKNIDFGEAQSKFIDGDPTQIKTIPRGKSTRGFARGYGSTYGDPFIRSDAQDGYGIVPMPGIIDANIRTKTAYGSLREAKVNFTCHNRRQLEILELLYMRPGFPVLLEWGWTPFINNAGELIKNFPYYRSWFSKNNNINNINKEIEVQKINHSGNYDGFVGFIKNFEISARADGGYDCTTHLTAMGEILEGLKGKRTGKTYPQENSSVSVDDFEYYLKSVKEFSEAYSGKFSNETIRQQLALSSSEAFETDILFPQNSELLESYQNLAFLIDKTPPNYFPTQEELVDIGRDETAKRQDIYNELDLGSETTQQQAGELPIDTAPDPYSSGKAQTDNGTAYETEIERIENILDVYILRKGEDLILNGINKQDVSLNINEDDFAKSQYTYIRWDFLANIFNNLVIPLYQTGEVNHPVVQIYQDSKLEYNTYKLKEKLINEIGVPETLKQDLSDLDVFLDISSNPKICLLPHQFYQKSAPFNEDPSKLIDPSTGAPADNISINRKISNIFFNVEYLLDTYKKMLYDSEGGLKEKFGILDFLNKIWEDVNQACAGTHNFTLQTDEPNHSNTVRVIDLAYQNKKLNNPNKLHEIKIQGNESIVRDFSYNTTIDNKFASTIAIAAQAPKSINSLDSITLEAFNKNIECRFFKSGEDKNLTDKQKVRLKNSYIRSVEQLQKNITEIKKHRENILKGTYNKDKISQNISRVKNLENKIIDISLKYGYDGKNSEGEDVYIGTSKIIADTNLSNISKSAVVPLKFGCIMDGISGIVIGNVFRVEKTKLPIGYQEDDIAFVVLTEDQKITAGQDWTTELSGQFILLDIAKETPSANTTQSDTSETENPTDDAIKEEENNTPDLVIEGGHETQTLGDNQGTSYSYDITLSGNYVGEDDSFIKLNGSAPNKPTPFLNNLTNVNTQYLSSPFKLVLASKNMLSPNGKSYILEPQYTKYDENSRSYNYFLTEPGSSPGRYIKSIKIDLVLFEIQIYEARRNKWFPAPGSNTSKDDYLKEIYYLYDESQPQISF